MKDDLPEKTDLINRKSKAAFMDSNPNEPEETLCNSEKTSSDGDDEADQDAAPNNSSVCRGLAISKVRYQAQELRRSLLSQMEQEMTCMMDEFITEVESVEIPSKFKLFLSDLMESGKRGKRTLSPDGSLPQKEFIPRNSLLTDLFEISHMQTIYNIFIAILLLLFINTVTDDLVDRGTISFDFQLIQWAFGNFRTVLLTWVTMMFATLVVVYPGFYCWSHYRCVLRSRLHFLLWDFFWLAAYVLYISFTIYMPVKEIIINNLPPASAVALLMEQVRLLMKTHAFVRSNVPNSLKQGNIIREAKKKNKSASVEVIVPDPENLCPDFSKFLYFLFAPTLVYRNHYPRTRRIRWKWVFWNFFQVVGILFYLYFIFVRFCVPVFRQIGQEPLTAKALVLSVFGCMLPGTLVLLCGFFLLLHAWMNAFAEMLRFADRMFYKDWWNSSTYATYYRTWNVVVHDWLYTYVYKDVHELCGRRNRFVPMVFVFGVSAFVHEFIITFTFRFFYPILLLMFGGVGFVFAFITNMEKTLGNIFMWLTLFMGTGLFMSLYSMEWYARINCPPSFDGFLDLVVPRSWTCITLG